MHTKKVVGINGMVIKQCIKYYRDSLERQATYISGGITYRTLISIWLDEQPEIAMEL